MPVGVYSGAQSSVGNGLTTVFPYAWKILDQTHIEVKVDGVVKVLGADYTVSGVGLSNGGNVTFIVAPPNGAVVQRARKVPYVRTNDYQANGDFKEDTVDGDFDSEEMQVQQLAADIARAFKAPLSVIADQVLTDAMWAARARMFLGFDDTGGLGVFASPTAGALVVSAFIQTLLDDADAATAAATLAVIAKAIGTNKGDTIGFTGNATPVRKAVGADGQVVAADSSQADGRVYIDNPARPNLLINPNWQIDQINEGALYAVTGGGANVQGPDGWTGVAVAAPGIFKLRTLADPDNAALKCLEITCTTIDAAIGAADDYHMESAVEGYDAAALMAGMASAQPITIQFKFKTSVAGVYGVSIANSAKNRSYVGIINVADANEHEYSLSLTMDAAGAWLYTNGVGLYLRLTLAAGANFQAAAGAWNAANNLTTAAQVNFMSNVANIAYLKRIQLIPGALVQAYRPADIQKELAKAQRYYEKSYDQGTTVGTATSSGAIRGQITISAGNFTVLTGNASFAAVKRAIPTMTGYSDVTGASGQFRDLTGAADIAAGFNETGMRGTNLQFSVAGTSSAAARGHYTANSRLS